MREVHTSGSSGEPIRLGQFLKLADAVELGSDVKLLLGTGTVLVNGVVETRRGRQLLPGDVVSVRGEQLLVH
ncbi:RNA-binding S4 domain-containing protein [Jatrophihabitans sp.]|uniref:RNA-binding S4 domain-containing protein n=1 Tax=Jatrophihabitans sp. TaxID=1932789 RepID=UPI002D04657F|nr:RNA-binding S4 domain-containing protein [Jatrophihabitans sp.]